VSSRLKKSGLNALKDRQERLKKKELPRLPESWLKKRLPRRLLPRLSAKRLPVRKQRLPRPKPMRKRELKKRLKYNRKQLKKAKILLNKIRRMTVKRIKLKGLTMVNEVIDSAEEETAVVAVVVEAMIAKAGAVGAVTVIAEEAEAATGVAVDNNVDQSRMMTALSCNKMPRSSPPVVELTAVTEVVSSADAVEIAQEVNGEAIAAAVAKAEAASAAIEVVKVDHKLRAPLRPNPKELQLNGTSWTTKRADSERHRVENGGVEAPIHLIL